RGRVEDDLTELVGDAGRHRAVLPGGEVVDVDPETGRRVVHGHDELVTGVHEQVGGPVRGERVGGGQQRVGRRVRHTVLGDEREVDRLHARLVQAVLVLADGVVRVPGQAVDVERRAPLPGVAGGAGRPRDPTGRVELHLHERGTRVAPDVVRVV